MRTMSPQIREYNSRVKLLKKPRNSGVEMHNN